MEQTLVGISEASQMLGVSETALRQWTDEGKIRAFVTPGGHRRYSRSELKKFMGLHHKVLGIKDLVTELEDTTQLHREIARTSLNSKQWYSKLDVETRERLAGLSRSMLSAITRYVAEPSERENTLKLARDIGRGFGEVLAALKLPLTDSVEAFVLHRDPVMKATARLIGKREAYTGRVVEAIPMVVRVMDEALVYLIAGHQQYCDVPAGAVNGENPE